MDIKAVMEDSQSTSSINRGGQGLATFTDFPKGKKFDSTNSAIFLDKNQADFNRSQLVLKHGEHPPHGLAIK